MTREWKVQSPDSKIQIFIMLDEDGELFYKAKREDENVLDYSPLGIVTNQISFTSGLIFKGSLTKVINESYELPHGKTLKYYNRANELALNLEKEECKLQIVFRAYNDGMAYRYQISGKGKVEISSELTEFMLPRDGLINIWAQKFMKCYERTYDLHMLEHLGVEEYAFPMLFQLGQNNWMLLTEAGIYGDYCASHLIKSSKDDHSLKLTFAPDQKEQIQSTYPFTSPWRAAIMGRSLAEIVESTLVFNLNPPSEVTDTSWIKPGRSAWSWFSDGASCGDMDIQKAYVDFAEEFNWEYSLVDGGWEGSELDVPELVSYAKPKGVGIWLWSHYRNLKDQVDCEAKLALWASWGIKGIKVDFFDSDAQETIQAYDRIAEIAAKYQLMVNYHGSSKPSGEQRRWPHVMTREGIYGAEYWRNISEGPNAVHNCTVPFTRNVVGSMDYTPVTFSKPTRTSHCHQLALSVIFESAVQNFADSIEAYRASVTKPFLKKVAAAWDQTRLLEGYPGRFVTMARRSGEEWYVGAICAAAGRTAEISLDFLQEDCNYQAEIYEEVFGEGDDYRFREATEVLIRSEMVTKEALLKLPMKVYGGCVIHLKKLN